jgi:acyl carrier protein
LVDRAIVVAVVREILVTSWPGRFRVEQLSEQVSLGAQGLGLDSVEIVEVLLECEERFGEVPLEELFRREPLTLRSLSECFAPA